MCFSSMYGNINRMFLLIIRTNYIDCGREKKNNREPVKKMEGKEKKYRKGKLDERAD